MRPTRYQARFDLAKYRFNEEIDLINIVQQLRHHKFLLETFLKPHQLLVIELFKKYVVTDLDVEEDKEDSTIKAEKRTL